MENETNELYTKTVIGKLYRDIDVYSETDVITVDTFFWRRKYSDGAYIRIHMAKLSNYYKNVEKEKGRVSIIIHESQFNDFVDLLRAALDNIVTQVENE